MREDGHGCACQDVLAFLERHYFGKYRAKVVDNADPNKRGRLLVQVDAPLSEPPIWALPCVPFAGPNVGLMMLPPIEANVWVEFEGGNPKVPIWSGCFWTKDEAIEGGGEPNKKIIKTEFVTITIDDDAKSVELAVANGSSLVLDASQIKAAASGEIVHEVSAKRTALSTDGFDINNGTLKVL